MLIGRCTAAQTLHIVRDISALLLQGTMVRGKPTSCGESDRRMQQQQQNNVHRKNIQKQKLQQGPFLSWRSAHTKTCPRQSKTRAWQGYKGQRLSQNQAHSIHDTDTKTPWKWVLPSIQYKQVKLIPYSWMMLLLKWIMVMTNCLPNLPSYMIATMSGEEIIQSSQSWTGQQHILTLLPQK